MMNKVRAQLTTDIRYLKYYPRWDHRRIARIVNANATTLVMSIGGLFANDANAIIAKLEDA